MTKPTPRNRAIGAIGRRAGRGAKALLLQELSMVRLFIIVMNTFQRISFALHQGGLISYIQLKNPSLSSNTLSAPTQM